MKKALTAAVLCCTLISGSALAHGDHGVISGQRAISIAAKFNVSWIIIYRLTKFCRQSPSKHYTKTEKGIRS